MKKPKPIFLADLFPILDQKLIQLLKSLSDEDWQKQTLAPAWKVKDVATHLLDGNMRTLSMLRDGYFGESSGEINSYKDLVAFLNRLNADWVSAMRRLSPKILVELLEEYGKQYCDFIKNLDPFEKAAFSVGWAGESESLNWFHIAREYTEKWHHQQQIRFAVGQEKELYEKTFYFPYLDTSMRALPHHYRDTKANPGDSVQFSVLGKGGGDWFLYFQENQEWTLVTESETPVICKVSIPGEITWRIFSKGISREDALYCSEIEGQEKLGIPIFDMLAVMA
ncbi:MAG: maleylpyruvate isomerase N-terminal domain-containing protein [Microscillaceae bacterium]|nr:maleylpyruvate isomerase N-terminal domain-containing protein [Microscillaceae bacterium]